MRRVITDVVVDKSTVETRLTAILDRLLVIERGMKRLEEKRRR